MPTESVVKFRTLDGLHLLNCRLSVGAPDE